MRQKLTSYLKKMSLERIVLLITIGLVVTFSITLDGFLSKINIFNLLRSVSTLGILGMGMAVVVISRGIDLSMVAVMAVSSAWVFELLQHGHNLFYALMCGLFLAIAVGVINSFMIAFMEIPPLFATLSSGLLVYGFGRSQLIELQNAYLPKDPGWIEWLGKGHLFSIPAPILIFLATGVILYVFHNRTEQGLFNYSVGDNPSAARLMGIPVRVVPICYYGFSALMAWLAGLIGGISVSVVNLQVVNSTMIYDVILVVVLGGISLSGGRGKVQNIIISTILIGTLINGMTLLNLPFHIQNIIRGTILLAAIIIDSVINPRNEDTAEQGDI
jgi:ribose transport system permease protein